VCGVLIDAAAGDDELIVPLTRLRLKKQADEDTDTSVPILPGRAQLAAAYTTTEVESRILSKLRSVSTVLLKDENTAALTNDDAAVTAATLADASRGPWLTARTEALAQGPLAEIIKEFGSQLPP